MASVFPIDTNYLLWVTIKGEKGEWYIVSDKTRSMYYLFKGKKQTARKSPFPSELEKYVR